MTKFMQKLSDFFFVVLTELLFEKKNAQATNHVSSYTLTSVFPTDEIAEEAERICLSGKKYTA